MRSRLYWSVAGFCCGILIHSFFNFSFHYIYFTALLGFVVLSYCLASQKVFTSRSKLQYSVLFLTSLFLIACSFGLFRYQIFSSFQGDEWLREKVGKKVTITGVVVDEPKQKETSTEIIIKTGQTKILVRDTPDTTWHYGDEVVIQGLLEPPKNFKTDNQTEFNYVAYLAKDHILYTINLPNISLIGEHQGSHIVEYILRAKEKFLSALDEVLPFAESKLAAGLIVAGKQALPKMIQDEFQKTGTIQVVVLSGFNVTIVAETILFILSGLPLFWSASLGALSIIVFVIAAGGSATIIRALIMALVALLGKVMKRSYNPGRALVFSGVVMLAINPMLLVFDPSFQLSFLATIGLMYFSPLVEKYFQWVTPRLQLRETMIATSATQLFLTPFLIFQTGSISLVVLPANLLLFLMIPIAMLLSFITGILALLSHFLVLPIQLVTFLILKTILITVHIFSELPFASVSLPTIPVYIIVAIYAWLFYCMIRRLQKNSSQSLPS